MAIVRKVHSGSLLDLETREKLVDGQFQITLDRTQELPRFSVMASLHAYLPELDGQRCILRLTDELEGEVQILGIIPPPTRDRMRVKVNLQDPVWRTPNWFEGLA